LKRLIKGRTCVVIAHHLNTIRQADTIFVIEGAEVCERGTHEQLLAAGGAYSKMYSTEAEGVGKWAEFAAQDSAGSERRRVPA
jgi:ABC-type multidrug transport system fused ATPase/permease subunit